MKLKRITLFALGVLAGLTAYAGGNDSDPSMDASTESPASEVMTHLSSSDPVKTKIATGLMFKKYPVIFTSVPKDPVLGEGWLSTPDSLIWFDIATDNQGVPIEMDHQTATQYCKKNNARLPTFSECSRLKRDFSARDSGYTPQILAHPEAAFWTEIPDFEKKFAYVFFGNRGELQPANPNFFMEFVRCVRKLNN